MALETEAGKLRLDVSRYELTVGGRRARLERQPMELLILLVQRKGQLVKREDIVKKLWGDDVFVDIDGGINHVIRKIRSALHDNPDHPRYLETVVGKGYRFIGEVEVAGAAPGNRDSPSGAGSSPAAVALRRSRYTPLVYGALLTLVVIAAWTWYHWRGGSSSQAGQIHSLAVLPLANLSGDPAQEYFADGMTDELITEIAQVGSLRVTSRTSALRYKATAKTAPEIARELHVDAILEGSVARAGERVRITAQLIDARADKHLWASAYETEPKDVLGMQDAVARDVAKQIRLRLTAPEQERLSRAHPVNPEAHEAYLKGLYHWNKRDRRGLEKAIEYFNQAIAKDPDYAPPYAGLASSYVPLTYYGYLRGTDTRSKVAATLAKALELDDSLAEAHAVLGTAKIFYDYDWEGAEKEFLRAIELNPSYSQAHSWYAQLLSAESRNDQALAEGKHALELDPLSLAISAGQGNRLYWARRYDEASAHLSHAALELDPNFPITHWYLGMVYAQQKKFQAAIRELEAAENLYHGENTLVLGGLGYAYGASGDTAQAHGILRHLERRARDEYVDPYAFALVYVGLKNKDKAFAWLEKAHEDRDCLIAFLNAEPALDDLRTDPRFQDLLRRTGLAH
ncbi:MAG TPA: winged helix-turn-helix domain-containing protein [Terriglobales bacterium]|nr:winged helix-turn-helix domain-containing protein [Terriglobales bacterium]